MSLAKKSKAGDTVVEMDRRRTERRLDESTVEPAADKPLEPRRKKQRRRQIDPTTCERDYNLEEIEFMQAMDAYKRSSGRMFPTCSEILEVIRGLGYLRTNSFQSPATEFAETPCAEIAEACLDD